MTPKEKAEELVNRFIYRRTDYVEIDDAKQFALIALFEINKEISKWAGGEFQEWEKERWKYLQEVKHEIQKL